MHRHRSLLFKVSLSLAVLGLAAVSFAAVGSSSKTAKPEASAGPKLGARAGKITGEARPHKKPHQWVVRAFDMAPGDRVRGTVVFDNLGDTPGVLKMRLLGIDGSTELAHELHMRIERLPRKRGRGFGRTPPRIAERRDVCYYKGKEAGWFRWSTKLKTRKIYDGHLRDFGPKCLGRVHPGKKGRRRYRFTVWLHKSAGNEIQGQRTSVTISWHMRALHH